MMSFDGQSVQIRHAVSLTLLISFTSIIAACHEPGLERTSFDEWEVKELPRLGARVEVPVDYYYGGVDFPAQSSFLMHPVWPPRGVIDEPRCILEVDLYRRSPEEVERHQASVDKKRVNEEEGVFWRWMHAVHHTVDRYDFGNQMVFRYDVACPNDDILVVDAVTRKMGGEKAQEWLEEDEKAIRRILESVECFEQTPLPTPTSLSSQKIQPGVGGNEPEEPKTNGG